MDPNEGIPATFSPSSHDGSWWVISQDDRPINDESHMIHPEHETSPCRALNFPVKFPEMEGLMTNTQLSPVTQWRKRRQRQGFVRVEIQIRKEDATLMREVASALVDPERATETRAILREKIAVPRSKGLKALLASAPLDGINLERQSEFGRDTTL